MIHEFSDLQRKQIINCLQQRVNYCREQERRVWHMPAIRKSWGAQAQIALDILQSLYSSQKLLIDTRR